MIVEISLKWIFQHNWITCRYRELHIVILKCRTKSIVIPYPQHSKQQQLLDNKQQTTISDCQGHYYKLIPKHIFTSTLAFPPEQNRCYMYACPLPRKYVMLHVVYAVGCANSLRHSRQRRCDAEHVVEYGERVYTYVREEVNTVHKEDTTFSAHRNFHLLARLTYTEMHFTLELYDGAFILFHNSFCSVNESKCNPSCARH